jgi:hypothetical protein
MSVPLRLYWLHACVSDRLWRGEVAAKRRFGGSAELRAVSFVTRVSLTQRYARTFLNPRFVPLFVRDHRSRRLARDALIPKER